MTRDRDLKTSAQPPQGALSNDGASSVRSVDASNPLTVIRERERALAAAIDAAHASANSLITQARARSAEIRERAEREGVEQARSLSDQALSRASEDAESIRRAGAASASDLLQSARSLIPGAVEEILRRVLPNRTSDVDSRAADR